MMMAHGSGQVTDAVPKAEAFWLSWSGTSSIADAREHALMAWYHAPHLTASGALRQSGVVLCPPFGHEYMVSYRSYKHLAEQLAQAGFPVIYFDYTGTGDSADLGGNNQADRIAETTETPAVPDEQQWQRWQNNVRLAMQKCRELSGVPTVSLFGVRLGGLLAASVAATDASNATDDANAANVTDATDATNATNVNDDANATTGMPLDQIQHQIASSEPGATGSQVGALIMLAPVISGRAYVRELLAFARLKNLSLVQSAMPSPEPGVDEVTGYALSAAMQADLIACDLLSLLKTTTATTLMVARDDMAGQEQRLLDKLQAHADQLRLQGDEPIASVALSTCAGYAAMMTDDAYNAQVPVQIWDTVVAWLSARFALEIPLFPARSAHTSANTSANTSAHTSAQPDVGDQPANRFPKIMRCVEAGRTIQEHLVCFSGLVGVVSTPAVVQSALPVVILNNVGANHRVATHRLYVTIARVLASQGFTVLRFDRAGFGYSKSNPSNTDNAIYADGGIDDLRCAMTFLQNSPELSGNPVGLPENSANQAQPRRFVLAGLCSGAYFAYKTAVPDSRVDGLILLNPLTFEWHPGDSLEIRKKNTFRSSGYYKKIVFDPHTWRRLFMNRINVSGIALVLFKRLYKRFRVALIRGVSRHLTVPSLLGQVARNFHAMERRGMKSLFIFDIDDGGIDVMTEHLGPNACLLGKSSQVGIEIISGVDHTFTPIWSHDEVSHLMAKYLKSWFLNGNNAQ